MKRKWHLGREEAISGNSKSAKPWALFIDNLREAMSVMDLIIFPTVASSSRQHLLCHDIVVNERYLKHTANDDDCNRHEGLTHFAPAAMKRSATI